ncbi:MAG: ATPase domain-containing protein [Elusimicrobiota bacterium]
MTEAVKKLQTGIDGLDKMLKGGIPEHRMVVVSGSAGAGKSVMLNSFLYEGIQRFSQNGVLITFEEPPRDIKKNVKGFGWDYDKFEEKDKLYIVDMTPEISGEVMIIKEDFDMSPIIERVLYAVDKVGAKRVVIDGIDSLFSRFKNKEIIRNTIYRLSSALKEKKVTGLIAMESLNDKPGNTRYGVEEFVTDGAIELKMEEGELEFIRKMFVRKLRGCDFRSGIVEYEINHKGMRVFSRLVSEELSAKTDFKSRLKTGMAGVDSAMSGGIPKGHTVLLSGNSGTGKTLFGLKFLIKGIENGNKSVMVALEESKIQIKKTALEHGWDLDKMEKNGQISFITANLLDTRPNKLLNDIKDEIEKTGATRLLIDSVSSLESAAMGDNDVRKFLIQLNDFLKAQGTTSILNYLASANFGASGTNLLSALKTNTLRLSSITDGILIMLYVESEDKVERVFNVLKMRGIQHDKSIIKYRIEKGGLKLKK